MKNLILIGLGAFVLYALSQQQQGQQNASVQGSMPTQPGQSQQTTTAQGQTTAPGVTRGTKPLPIQTGGSGGGGDITINPGSSGGITPTRYSPPCWLDHIYVGSGNWELGYRCENGDYWLI